MGLNRLNIHEAIQGKIYRVCPGYYAKLFKTLPDEDGFEYFSDKTWTCMQEYAFNTKKYVFNLSEGDYLKPDDLISVLYKKKIVFRELTLHPPTSKNKYLLYEFYAYQVLTPYSFGWILNGYIRNMYHTEFLVNRLKLQIPRKDREF